MKRSLPAVGAVEPHRSSGSGMMLGVTTSRSAAEVAAARVAAARDDPAQRLGSRPGTSPAGCPRRARGAFRALGTRLLAARDRAWGAWAS